MNTDTDSDVSTDLKNGPLLGGEDDASFFKLPFEKVWTGIKTIGNATLATSLSLLFIYSINLVSLAFITNLSDAAMIGGLGLGFVFSNCCAYILITSIDQGVNALAAQAFGANKLEHVALNYHRGLFLILVCLIPVLILLGFTKQLLIVCGLEANVAQYAWEYIEYAYPSFFFYGIFDCTKSYLYAQNIFKPILYTQLLTTVLHFLWAWLFISKLGLGCAGAGIAKNIYELSNMGIMLLYVNYSDSVKQTWVPFGQIEWREKVLKWEGMKVFLGVVIPMAALLFLDMACYEVFTILAGQFGEDQLAVHVAIANSATVYYSIPLGMSIAMMTYVGNAVGARKPNAAKNYTYFGLILNLIVTAGFVALLWTLRVQWATLFSPNETVKDLLLQVLNIYVLFIFFDGVQVSLSGTMKGIGKQTAATIGLIISYYFIALPLIWWLSFRMGWKVKGIWGGFLVGIIVLLGMYLVVLAFTNFKAQSRKIRKGFRAMH